ncbi:MAG: hypothetical protein CM15mV41_0510 [Caudoviricetes sp.]|nr:MAG: hypothetical protein CM15mV41_0510 [Caudoviricetes sp.]
MKYLIVLLTQVLQQNYLPILRSLGKGTNLFVISHKGEILVDKFLPGLSNLKKTTISQRCRTILRIWKYSPGSLGRQKNLLMIIQLLSYAPVFLLVTWLLTFFSYLGNPPLESQSLNENYLLVCFYYSTSQKKMDYLEWDLNEYSYEVVTHHDIPNKDDGYIVIRKVPRPVDGWKLSVSDSYLDDVLE